MSSNVRTECRPWAPVSWAAVWRFHLLPVCAFMGDRPQTGSVPAEPSAGSHTPAVRRVDTPLCVVFEEAQCGTKGQRLEDQMT